MISIAGRIGGFASPHGCIETRVAVALAVELGEGGRARELARDVAVSKIPSAGRQAMFYADVARGMATERATRVQAVHTFLRAEDVAPQMIRTNFYVRQTVCELLGRLADEWRLPTAPR